MPSLRLSFGLCIKRAKDSLKNLKHSYRLIVWLSKMALFLRFQMLQHPVIIASLKYIEFDLLLPSWRSSMSVRSLWHSIFSFHQKLWMKSPSVTLLVCNFMWYKTNVVRLVIKLSPSSAGNIEGLFHSYDLKTLETCRIDIMILHLTLNSTKSETHESAIEIVWLQHLKEMGIWLKKQVYAIVEKFHEAKPNEKNRIKLYSM